MPQGEIKAGVGKRHAGTADDARIVVWVFEIAEGEDVDLMSQRFEGAFVRVNITRHAADVGLVGVCHHSDSHGLIVQGRRGRVKKDEG